MAFETAGFNNCCGVGIIYNVKCVPNIVQFTRALHIARNGRWGVMIFIDNAAFQQAYDYSVPGKMIVSKKEINGGKAWAEFIRNQGYRVDEIYLGGNPNHDERDPHKLTAYFWYVNKEKDKESVYVGKQPEKAAPKGSIPGVSEGEGVAARVTGRRIWDALSGLGAGIGF